MTAETAAKLRDLASAGQRGDKVKAAIDRAAKRAGLTYWRAFDIWYGKARQVEQSEIDAIDAALRAKRREENRNELHELYLRLARLEARLAQEDPDYERPSVDLLGAALRPAR